MIVSRILTPKMFPDVTVCMNSIGELRISQADMTSDHGRDVICVTRDDALRLFVLLDEVLTEAGV